MEGDVTLRLLLRNQEIRQRLQLRFQTTCVDDREGQVREPQTVSGEVPGDLGGDRDGSVGGKQLNDGRARILGFGGYRCRVWLLM